MKAKASSFTFRKFCRRLVTTALILLLPCQLALLWVAHLDQPVKLPDFVTDFLADALARRGIRLQARSFWLLPDRSLAADDLSLEIEGLTGSVFTAERLEIGLNLIQLSMGQVSPTRLRLQAGKIWCPASVAQNGQRRALIEDLYCSFSKEGQWLMLPTLQARANKLRVHVSGELPSGIFRELGEVDDPQPGVTSVSKVVGALSRLEQGLAVTEKSSGVSLNVIAHGEANGGAALDFKSLLGARWVEPGFGLIETRDFQARGQVHLDAAGRLKKWDVSGEILNAILGEYSAQRLSVRLTGGRAWHETTGSVRAHESTVSGFPIFQLEAKLRYAQTVPFSPLLDFNLSTGSSQAHGTIQLKPRGNYLVAIGQANIDTKEFQDLAFVRPMLRPLQISLGDSILLNQATLHLNALGEIQTADGRLAVSGLKALGISADTVAPHQNLPLVGYFNYQADRSPFPLKLKELRLASIRGEADCSLLNAGPFVLNLSGAIAPGSLDRLLGDWWIELWKLFPRYENPSAMIFVESHWGAPTGITKGRVELKNFVFLGAPFRSVAVSIDANAKETFIGLHQLAGGTEAKDGQVDGSAVWDWSKQGPLAGPTILLHGDLQPWIAAQCGNPELGQSLKGLALPAGHDFHLEITPGMPNPKIRAKVSSAGDFTAWSIPSRNLFLAVESQGKDLKIETTLEMAGGKTVLSLSGDPLHQSDFVLSLQGCDPMELGKIISLVESTTGQTTKPTAAVSHSKPSGATLDLNLTGRINLQNPRLLRGLGDFRLHNPELRKVRILGGVSRVLEAFGVDATTYGLTDAKGRLGCLDGTAYFPDLVISGPQASLVMAGEINLLKSTVNFEGDFSLPRHKGFALKDLLNLNRTLVSLTKIRLKGPILEPDTRAIPELKDIIKSNKDNELGKIPRSILE